MGPRYRQLDALAAYHMPLADNIPPKLFRGVISDWPALSRWSLDYFSLHFPSTMVRLERFDPKSTTSYLEQTVENVHITIPFARLREELTAAGSCYAVRENSDIFCQVPSLLDDLCGFRPFDVNSDGYKSLWIGPEGYVTGMHTDPGPTLVCEIRGLKRVVLFPPSEAARVYAVKRSDVVARFSSTSLRTSLEPSELEDLVERTGWADVQPFEPDFIRYPLFAGAEGLACTLKPGDVLYIPDGWWHAVLGLDVTISVAIEPRINRCR